MMFPKHKERPLKSLIHSLDRVFSEYIRLRDADGMGYCRCVTCGNRFHWKSGDCGHFVQRDRIAVRWDERNASAQCPRCNRFRSGEQYEHGKAIDRRWGTGTADMLRVLGQARGTKIDRFWIEVKIGEFREKLKKMKKIVARD
jgi:hypothetical protein